MQSVFAGAGVDVYSTISHNLSTLPTSNQFVLDGGDPVSWSAQTALTRSSWRFCTPGPETVTKTSHGVVEIRLSTRDTDCIIYYRDFIPDTCFDHSTSTRYTQHHISWCCRRDIGAGFGAVVFTVLFTTATDCPGLCQRGSFYHSKVKWKVHWNSVFSSLGQRAVELERHYGSSGGEKTYRLNESPPSGIWQAFV
ncbi:hypothetical protein PM082_023051 [Marasmius tenuissimus]|nr:hypothetical protein PM082_023051 [Marasmius tenuissimus]